MKILQLTCHFRPNIGGVETHLDDLVSALAKRKHDVFVLTYQPLVTKTSWKIFEKRGNTQILRIPWLPGFFYKLVDKPSIEFLYLFPGLFLVTPLILLIRRLEVVHSHGLVAGFVAVFWGKLFQKRSVVTTHSIYHFPKSGLYRFIARWVFTNATYSLGLSDQAVGEIKSLGVKSKRVGRFTYWIDLKKFKVRSVAQSHGGVRQSSKFKIKDKLGWKGKFVVLFVGRLVPEKGIPELLEAARNWNRNITLAIAGTGPLEDKIRSTKPEIRNLIYLGKIPNDKLPPFYSAADLVIIPSTHEEGFGRVILESLACGTPVIGAKRGAIPEAMDETVGKLIEITPKNINDTVEYFYRNPSELKILSSNARKFAVKRYSEKNVETIIRAYE